MNILVIEDNPQNMKLISCVLKKSGHFIIEASCGLEGLEKATSLQPDLILMDIQLPDIDGLDTTRKIRKNLLKIPIIAITSYAMAGDREKVMEAGCNGYFEKPINPLTIMKDIEKVLRERNP
jgi:two-component system cell cycle response regulator DivK